MPTTPTNQRDSLTRVLRDQYGPTYLAARRLPDGSYALLSRLFTTVAIHLGVDELGWQRRFCYQDMAECLHAWEHLQTRADEPEGWIARRPKVEED